ncbi:MAG: oxygenase MpaB family protein [Bacteroidota bacterium]|nr:oxygenase MpaB family protein [Bacteroidota bacterium]
MRESSPILVPTSYQSGYAKARRKDPVLADLYAQHTTIGDPELDPVFEECVPQLDPDVFSRYVRAGIEGREEFLAGAPDCLREFFHKADTVKPPWLNYESFRPAGRAVYKNASLMLAAFVAGVLVEGFSTMIAKSFRMTGRVGSKNTKRRLGYNARHILEIFYPGGMLRPNDGWKMTMRIRFVHAKVRYLLNRFDEWDKEAWGCPVSAAHLGYATAVFSMRLIHFSKILGVKFNREEQEGVMDVFRYVGYLFGVPDAILYEDKKAAERIFKIGMLCEPPPDEDSAFMANQLVRAVPSVTGIENVKEAEEQIKLGYALSGILIGRKMAKDLQFPYYNGFIALFLFRTRIFLESVLKDTQFVRRKNFMELLGISSYDDIIGISYKLPTHVKDAMSQDW